MHTHARSILSCFGILALVVLATTLLGAAQPGKESAPPTAKDARTTPQLAYSISFDSGMVLRAEDDHTGVLLAAWDDGVVIFAADTRKPKTSLRVGRLTPEQVRGVLDELHTARFFEDLPGGGTAPDASYTTIKATREQKSAKYLCMWSDVLALGGASVDSPAAEKEFARMWAVSRTILAFARPGTSEPLASNVEAKRRFERAEAQRVFR